MAALSTHRRESLKAQIDSKSNDALDLGIFDASQLISPSKQTLLQLPLTPEGDKVLISPIEDKFTLGADMLITSPKQLGIYLRDVRRTQGRNQTKVGDIVGLKQTTVSKLERDPASSSIESLMRLLSSLDLELHIQDKAVSRQEAKLREPDDW